jgi:hypothetical protein
MLLSKVGTGVLEQMPDFEGSNLLHSATCHNMLNKDTNNGKGQRRRLTWHNHAIIKDKVIISAFLSG